MSCASNDAAATASAEDTQTPKGAARAAAMRDRLHNRERQSLSQVTQLAAKLQQGKPGLVHAVKHVATARKSVTYIIFDRHFEAEDDDEGEEEGAASAAPKPEPKPKPSAKPPKQASRPPPLEPADGGRPTPHAKSTPPAAQQGAGAKQKLNRNALSACGDAAKGAKAAKADNLQATDRELEIAELSSLVGAAKSIANEIVSKAPPGSRVRRRALMIDGHEACALQVIDGSRAAGILDTDPPDFGATVKRLFLSATEAAGDAELRLLLAPPDHMDADAPPPRAAAWQSASKLFGTG